jgi:hypothetical protein
MNFDIRYLSDLKILLQYKDTRSVCDYCRRNSVEILGTGKRRYVLAAAFQRSQLNEKINDLKMKYGSHWLEVLQSEMNLCAQLQSALDSIENSRSNSPIKSREKPKGKAETKFLLDIKNILR